MNIKFAYIRDPENYSRVVTIGYYLTDNEVRFDAIVNKVVDAKSLRVDQRLREIVGNIEFLSIEKRLKKRFGGDNHCKRSARSILTGRLKSQACLCSYTYVEENPPSKKDTLKTILIFLANSNPDTIRDVCIRYLAKDYEERTKEKYSKLG